MNFVGFSNKDFPKIPPAFRMDGGSGKFVLLLKNAQQHWQEGDLLAGDIDRHGLLVALHLGLPLALRTDLEEEDMDGIVLREALAVGRGLIPAAGTYYFSTDQVCHIRWGSHGYGVNLYGNLPKPPEMAGVVKETLTNGLKNDPRLWSRAG